MTTTIPSREEYEDALEILKWSCIHTDEDRATARAWVAEYEGNLAGRTVLEVMTALACDVRAPGGSARAGSGGHYCAKHREYATPESCPAAVNLLDRLEAAHEAEVERVVAEHEQYLGDNYEAITGRDF